MIQLDALPVAAPPDAAAALTAGLLDGNHRDPFDRMLAAQAHLEQLSLRTIDPVFDERVELTVVPA